MHPCVYDSKLTEKTLDLSQVAPATYDAATAVGDVLIKGIALYCSVAGGGDLTSVSIQTNSTTPLILLTAAEGAVANLLAQSHPNAACNLFIGPWTLRSGQKIQYSLIAAGAAHTGTLKLVINYRPISVGASL